MDHAPIGYTCPKIDKSLDYITDAVSALEDASVIIEEIREANDILRQWGNDEHCRADEVEEELTEVKIELEMAQEEVKVLETENDELQTKLAAMEDKFNALQETFSEYIIKNAKRTESIKVGC